jgi:DNA-binding NarL/FixJ family response regulator
MARILFIDDDPAELESFRKIVAAVHECTTALWPKEAGKLHPETPPDLVLSDLYLPSVSGDVSPTEVQRNSISNSAKEASDRFSQLTMETRADDKSRLRQMMGAISVANEMLRQQWTAMGQSPDNGIAILKQFKALYPTVPFVFYSRKITPEDVVRVVREGAVDAIRKGAFPDDQVLTRLAETIRKSDVQRTECEESAKTRKLDRESPRVESSASSDDGFSVRPTALASWIDAGTKAFGLFTALFTFLVARGKFLDWLKGSHALVPTILSPTSGSGMLGMLFSLYLIVYLFFVTGSVLERVFAEIMNLGVAALRFVPSIKSKVTRDLMESLKKSVPRIVDLTWDVCVVLFAVIPALRYTVQILASL